MTLYELELHIHELDRNINLSDFLRLHELTQDEFISIVCMQEIEELQQRYKHKSILPMKIAAEAMGISYPHLVRLKKNGKSIPYTQEGESAPVYFPILSIAVHNYLRAHPIFPNRMTFSNLLSEI